MSDRSETDHERARTGPYDHARWEDSDEDVRPPSEDGPDKGEPDKRDEREDIDLARENVLEGWPVRADGEDAEPELDSGLGHVTEPEPLPEASAGSSVAVEEPADVGAEQLGETEPVAAETAPGDGALIASAAVAATAATSAPPVESPDVPGQGVEEEPGADGDAPPSEHAAGAFAVPPGYAVLEGEPNGSRRAVGLVVSRFNGEITTRLLDSALAELEQRGVTGEAITVMPVPGAFELPLAAMALAKTRRFSCIVALGCVIRGDTAHFDYVAGEAASGLQLAGLETGVPVSFGVLTLEDADQAENRLDKGAEAVRTALEMADLFANLRTAAAQ